MSYRNLLIEDQGAIRRVIVNRPDKLNALNHETIGELHQAFGEAESAAAIRVVVLTGAGPKAFVAGADIAEMNGLSPVQARDFSRHGQDLMRRIEELGKPVVAMINGFALGGGMELAMACHLRIAADTAKLGQPEVNLGLIPGFGGTQRLPRLVGPHKALEMNLIGDEISGPEAAAYGLANRVVADHELMDTALSWARKLAGQAPIAVREIKDVSNKGDLDEGIEAEKAAFGTIFASNDAREGISAFLGKRTPNWTGT